jgi:hypothetical protein
MLTTTQIDRRQLPDRRQSLRPPLLGRRTSDAVAQARSYGEIVHVGRGEWVSRYAAIAAVVRWVCGGRR